MTRGFTDGMREPLRPPGSDDDTYRPSFGDLLKVMDVPGLLTLEEAKWYRNEIRHMLGLPDYPEEEYIDPDTPLPTYTPEDF